jgi:Mce-associated membrane protein
MAEGSTRLDGQLTDTSGGTQLSMRTSAAAVVRSQQSPKQHSQMSAADESDVSHVHPRTAESTAAPGEDRTASTRAMSPVWLATAVGVAGVVILATIGGWFGYRVYEGHQAEQQRRLFLHIGRQAALNLATIDWKQADGDIRRILDSATGAFYENFSKGSPQFVDAVKKMQSKSTGTLTEAGLESESPGEARVLVAVSVTTSNNDGPESDPHGWRLRISLLKVGDGAKVSNVEFVP